MKWEVVEGEDSYSRLHVEADWSEVAADYDDIVAGYVTIPVPGFRSGKVPRAMTEKRFQKEIIDELSRRAMQRFARRVFQEAGIEALGPVEADEIECVKGQSLRAQLRFHPMPDFELPDLGSLATDEGSTDPRDQISLRLLDLVRFDIPDELVRDELLVDGIDGVEPGDAGWNTARDRVRLMIILRQIARQEGIEVDEKDVDDRIAEKAGEFGTTKDSLQTELEQGGGMQRLRDMLLAESTLEYVMERNTE